LAQATTLTWLWTRGKTKKAKGRLEAPTDEAATTNFCVGVCLHTFAYENRSSYLTELSNFAVIESAYLRSEELAEVQAHLQFKWTELEL